MNTKKVLGRTGIEVSELCFGTLILGPLQADLSPREGAKAIQRALELGVNFIDSAITYKTHDHVRHGIEGFNDIIIASKSPVKTADEMRNHVETCLRELGRDTIDIFDLHLVKSSEDMREREDALHVLVKCREAGMIRAIGISTHGIKGTQSALEYNEIEVVFPIMNNKGLGILDGTRDELLDIIKELRADGRGIYSMKPLGGGHLIDDIPSAIEYLQNLELIDSICVGLKTPEEAEVMVGIFDKNKSAVERALEMGKDRANRKELIIYDFKCRKCGACVNACEQGALSLVKGKVEVNKELCILCGYCAVDCPEFSIRVI